MRLLFAVTLCFGLLLQGCAVNKLKKELERADSSYAYLRVLPIDSPRADANILVVVYQINNGAPELINYRTIGAGDDAWFLLPIEDYNVAAFEDLNGDFTYQAGEPAALALSAELYTGESEARTELDYEKIEGISLLLSSDTTLAIPLDLSNQLLEANLDDINNRYLKVVDWDYSAFSEESVSMGLWQPLSFHEQIGFGLYLLEPLDPDKIPVLLVHGINGSPLNFKDLASQLDPRFQPMLFQYPSGFPLDNTSYILHIGLTDLLERYPYPQIHVLAHSMGGLVARGMINLNKPSINARIGSFTTLSTPWAGHEAARLGVEWSPAVAPVWRSMVPNSEYLKWMQNSPLPVDLPHHLLFTYSQSADGASKGNDGVVTVKSQLSYPAQREASVVYGIDDSHNGILINSCVRNIVDRVLAGETPDRRTAMTPCRAAATPP